MTLVKSLHSFIFFRYIRALRSDPVDPADEGPGDGQVQGLRVHRLPRGGGRQEGHGTSQRIRAGRPPHEGAHLIFCILPELCCGPVTFWYGFGSGSADLIHWIRLRNLLFLSLAFKTLKKSIF